MKVGDVISIGPHRSVPKNLEHKFFRVEAVEPHAVRLSRPYLDAKLTIPYTGNPHKR